MTRESFKVVRRGGVAWLRSGELARFPWLIHGFSTRLAWRSGSGNPEPRQERDFNLGFTEGARRAEVQANRERFASALAEDFTLASLKQIHSATVYHVVRRNANPSTVGSGGTELQYRAAGSEHPALRGENGKKAGAGCQPDPLASTTEAAAAGDALLTAEAGILLTVRFADCLPVLLVDQRLRVIAAIHAGWRGTLARIVEKSVGEMRRLFNSQPADLVAALGPSIGSCCCEVGDEVVDAFRAQFAQADRFFRQPPSGSERDSSALRYTMPFHTQAPPGHRLERARFHLDLAAAAREQLLAAGLKPSAIGDSGYCTACRADLFFSYRREGVRAGRMMAAIGVRP